MSDFLLMGVGGFPLKVTGTTAAINPQLRFFENFPGKDLGGRWAHSDGTLYVHAVNIPISISFNYPVFFCRLQVEAPSDTTIQGTISFGLYSLNGSTLSLANSASATAGLTTNANSSLDRWISLITSATQNITPGTWYFANIMSKNGFLWNPFGNSSINPANAQPTLVMGRMTASTNAMPATIATSNLDITGSDAIRQPYIILTA